MISRMASRAVISHTRMLLMRVQQIQDRFSCRYLTFRTVSHSITWYVVRTASMQIHAIENYFTCRFMISGIASHVDSWIQTASMQVHAIQNYFICGYMISRTASHPGTTNSGVLPMGIPTSKTACFVGLNNKNSVKEWIRSIIHGQHLLSPVHHWLAPCAIWSGGPTVTSVISRVRCEMPSYTMQFVKAEPQNHSPLTETCPISHKDN